MPKRLNPNENGLRRYAHLHESREKEEPQKRKAHTTYGTTEATKVAFGVFSLFALASSVKIPKHQKNTNATFNEQVTNRFHEVSELYNGTLNKIHHLFYSPDITTNETFTLCESMKQEDRLSFVDAMEKEIHDHEKGGHWNVVHLNTITNKANPIKPIWSFKKKRKPDGELSKHKFCLCSHGGMQQWGDSYWETYSPLVNMLTIRLILAIAKIHSLYSKAIYFVLAFPQADLEEYIWMKLPIVFQVDGQTEADTDKQYVLKLNKNLYGLKQGSFNWYEKLNKLLVNRYFKPSDIDTC